MCIRLGGTLPPASVILIYSIISGCDRYSCFVQGSIIIVLEIAEQGFCVQNPVLWFSCVTSLLHVPWGGVRPVFPRWGAGTAAVLPSGARGGFSLWRS